MLKPISLAMPNSATRTARLGGAFFFCVHHTHLSVAYVYILMSLPNRSPTATLIFLLGEDTLPYSFLLAITPA
jgi:hypothetical protein